MRRILSKTLIVTLIIISLMNFIFSNYAFASINDDLKNVEGIIDSVTGWIGGVVSIVFWPKRLMVTGISFVANAATAALAEMHKADFGSNSPPITPFDIFLIKLNY